VAGATIDEKESKDLGVGRGEDDDADTAVIAGLEERPPQVPQQRVGEGVAGDGLIEGDRRDVIGDRVAKVS
jgi:hypothetical protein